MPLVIDPPLVHQKEEVEVEEPELLSRGEEGEQEGEEEKVVVVVVVVVVKVA